MAFGKKKNKKSMNTSEKIVTIGALTGMVVGFICGLGSWDYVWPIGGAGIGLILSAVICSVVEERKKKKTKQQREERLAQERANMDTEKLDRIIDYLKEKSGKTVYRIETAEGAVGLTDSKFGGYPYWPEGKPYPTAKNGEKLLLLAQINFGKEQLDDSLLPQKGILQIFAANDDVVGCDFAYPSPQDGFRVVYHDGTEPSMTVEEMQAQDIPANIALDKQDCMFPFAKEWGITFRKDIDFVNDCVADYEELVAQALRELYGEEMQGKVHQHFTYTEQNYLAEPFYDGAYGHKMLGYPTFVQWDPRTAPTEAPEAQCTTAHYDVLLLQIDSQGSDIMWGDCGVCNFMINSEALRNLDFSDVLYNWDCS